MDSSKDLLRGPPVLASPDTHSANPVASAGTQRARPRAKGNGKAATDQDLCATHDNCSQNPYCNSPEAGHEALQAGNFCEPELRTLPKEYIPFLKSRSLAGTLWRRQDDDSSKSHSEQPGQPRKAREGSRLGIRTTRCTGKENGRPRGSGCRAERGRSLRGQKGSSRTRTLTHWV